MKIGIVGKGFVGNATGKVLSKVHDIVYYDKYMARFNNPRKLKGCKVIFLCVPTLMKPNGEINLDSIKDSLFTITELCGITKPLFVMKSTAVPGTADRIEELYDIRMSANPEFLTQNRAYKDMLNPTRIVIGKYKELYKVYKPLFPKRKWKYVFCSNVEAEMIKYSSNIMLAGQIGIANELYRICDSLEIDYSRIVNGMLMDNRIGRNILVPGPDGKTGFGGACFPKDLNALIYFAKEQGYDAHVLKEIWRSNKR